MSHLKYVRRKRLIKTCITTVAFLILLSGILVVRKPNETEVKTVKLKRITGFLSRTLFRGDTLKLSPNDDVISARSRRTPKEMIQKNDSNYEVDEVSYV